VIWRFAKDGQEIRYELRRDNSDGPYHLVRIDVDGTESITEIDQATDVVEQTAEVMRALRRDGWRLI
jgi:hypothetical protein